MTPSGKPDDAALRAVVREESAGRVGRDRAGDRRRGARPARRGPGPAAGDGRRQFVGLGGDSLSYVEVSTRLGERLGALPPTGRPCRPPSSPRSAPWRSRAAGVPSPSTSSMVLRAVAITLVVVTHADLFQLQGGAHVLLAVAGYNLARFQLAVPGRRERVRAACCGAPGPWLSPRCCSSERWRRWARLPLANRIPRQRSHRWRPVGRAVVVLVPRDPGLVLSRTGPLLAVPLVARGQRAAPLARRGAARRRHRRAVRVDRRRGRHHRALHARGGGWCVALGICAGYARTVPAEAAGRGPGRRRDGGLLR